MATDRKQQQEQKTRDQEACDSRDISSIPAEDKPTEIGGPEGPEPTRYGDWEKRGRCIDF